MTNKLQASRDISRTPVALNDEALDSAVGGGIVFVGGWGSSSYQYATSAPTSSSGHSGGVNVALADGSVRTG